MEFKFLHNPVNAYFGVTALIKQHYD